MDKGGSNLTAPAESTRFKTPSKQTLLGAGLFLVGLIVAIVFSIVVAWPDQEATTFDMTPVEMAPLRSLRCPLIITPKDKAAIGVSISNTHVRPTTLRIRSRISKGSVSFYREDVQQIALEPGEQKLLIWPISLEDAAYDRFVMARVNQFQRTPFPARASSCGVLALNIPGLTGNQIVALLASAAGLCLAAGIVEWLRAGWPLTTRRRGAAQRAGLMLALVALSIVAGLLQMPVMALLALLLSAVFVVSLIERLI
jgi:hypothetical protein